MILETVIFDVLLFLFLSVFTLCDISITTSSSMPGLSLKSVSSSFSQSSHVSFGLSLMSSTLKLFRFDRFLRSIQLIYKLDLVDSHTFPARDSQCVLNSLPHMLPCFVKRFQCDLCFFLIRCFSFSVQQFVDLLLIKCSCYYFLYISVTNFSSVHNVASSALSSNPSLFFVVLVTNVCNTCIMQVLVLTN